MNSSADTPIQTVDYDVLDRAKQKFIEAGRRTTSFASGYGFMPGERFGASANVFSLDLKPFLAAGADRLHITLLPEGLGTADDTRPDDLTQQEATRFWYNIGIKSVAVMTNDAASSGMQTILISLYLPSSTPELVFDESFLSGFLDGFVDACREVGCVYFSGETPQLKTKMVPGRVDVAGALFGLLPPGVPPLSGEGLKAGHRIVLVESSGPHENGFTSLRGFAARLEGGYRTKLPSGVEYWQAINAPSKLYTPFVQEVLRSGIRPAAIENITGHGWQKIMRSSLPLRYVIEEMLPVPEVFGFIESALGVKPLEMLQIFNYGAGMAVFVEDESAAAGVVAAAARCGLAAKLAGRIEAAARREVVIEPLSERLSSESFLLQR